MIFHFQGRSYLFNKELVKELKESKVVLPNNLSIVTCINNEKIGFLIKQLKRNNVQYINTVPDGIEWDNRLKIKYIIEALKLVKTKYVLILDAIDVLFDFDNKELLNTFFKFNKKLIFNASKNNYPKVNIDNINNRDLLGDFKYFNAGCCIGELEYTKHFYNECLKIIDIKNEFKSEQFILRHIFDKEQNNVGIDNNCLIFQTMSGCISYKENEKWIIK